MVARSKRPRTKSPSRTCDVFWILLGWLLNRPSHLEALQWDQWDLPRFNLKAHCNLTKHCTKKQPLFFSRVCFARLCVRGDGFASKYFLHSMLETIKGFNFNILWALGKKPLKFGCDQESSEGIWCTAQSLSIYTLHAPTEFESTTKVQYIFFGYPSKKETDTPLASCQVPSGRGKR